MERDLFSWANQHLVSAEYLLGSIYPTTADQKIYLRVLAHLYEAIANTATAILVPKLNPVKVASWNQEQLLCEFMHSAPSCGLEEYVPLIETIQSIHKLHKSSPVEFSRHQSYVICTKEYQMTILSENLVWGFVTQTKNLVHTAAASLCYNE